MTRGSDHTALVLYLNLHSNDGLIANLRKSYTVTTSVHCIKPYTVRIDSLVSFIMTAEGHLLFLLLVRYLPKCRADARAGTGDWWHIVPSAILTCLLPDIDHPKSFLGQRLKWISKPIARAFGHRGFTHSLLAVFALLATFTLRFLKAGSFRLMRCRVWCWVI